MELLGLRTIIYRVKDLNEAKVWYSEFLGKKPYFDQPFYVGFNVGGYELGLHPFGEDEKIELGNNVETYLGVPNLKAAHEQALQLGAKVNTDIQDVGEDIQVATYRDPFGNLIGLIENPHFKIENN